MFPKRCRRLSSWELQVPLGWCDWWLDGRAKSEPNKWSGDGNTVCYSGEWQARSSREAAELALNRQDIPFSQLSARNNEGTGQRTKTSHPIQPSGEFNFVQVSLQLSISPIGRPLELGRTTQCTWLQLCPVMLCTEMHRDGFQRGWI